MTMMQRTRQLLAMAWLAAAVIAAWPGQAAGESAASALREHVLVVYNREAGGAKELAAYYAGKRGIPADRVLAIACPDAEEISRADYVRAIRDPIDSYLQEKGWLARETRLVELGPVKLTTRAAARNAIWAIVLIRGVPLKIRDEQPPPPPAPPPKPGEKPPAPPPPKPHEINGAAVDSELATLPVEGLPENGFLPNPFALSAAAKPRRFNADDARTTVLVTRLDGPSGSDVLRMIEDSLYAEANRLAGWALIDARGIRNEKNGYYAGDQWMRNAAALLAREGWPVNLDDREELFPITLPVTDLAWYLGWYTGKGEGPFLQPPRRFARGAIAYHLHSFSASTVRDRTQAWVGPLLTAGAAATMGAVYEPYLQFTPHVDVFVAHLLDGASFAEAAYASQPALSWMVTMIGDPLYTPFREPLPVALATALQSKSPSLPWLALQDLRRSLLSGTVAATRDGIRDAIAPAGRGPVAAEALGDLLRTAGAQDPAAQEEIENAYRLALNLQPNVIAKIRIASKLAEVLRQAGNPLDADTVLRELALQHPAEARTTGLVKEPPPAATAAKPSPPPLGTPEKPPTAQETRDYLKSLMPQPPKPKGR